MELVVGKKYKPNAHSASKYRCIGIYGDYAWMAPLNGGPAPWSIDISAYDWKELPPEPSSIDWSQVEDKWKYLAINANGGAYFYTCKPRLSEYAWVMSGGESANATAFKSLERGEVRWELSCIERPSS